MLKEIMHETEMEQYLKSNGYKIENEEGTDSTIVVDEAVGLGYDSYMLDGDGELDQTLIFIKKTNLSNK